MEITRFSSSGFTGKPSMASRASSRSGGAFGRLQRRQRLFQLFEEGRLHQGLQQVGLRAGRAAARGKTAAA